MCGVDNFFITYVEIYRDFTEAYRIAIVIAKQEHGYKPYFVRPGHIFYYQHSKNCFIYVYSVHRRSCQSGLDNPVNN